MRVALAWLACPCLVLAACGPQIDGRYDELLVGSVVEAIRSQQVAPLRRVLADVDERRAAYERLVSSDCFDFSGPYGITYSENENGGMTRHLRFSRGLEARMRFSDETVTSWFSDHGWNPREGKVVLLTVDAYRPGFTPRAVHAGWAADVRLVPGHVQCEPANAKSPR